MGAKKNKKNKGSSALAPPVEQDATLEPGVIDPFDDENGEELLAALDERDTTTAAKSEDTKSTSSQKQHHFRDDIREAGERIINGLTGNHGGDSGPGAGPGSPSTSPPGRRASLRRIFGARSPDNSSLGAGEAGKKKPSRQQQRKERKAAEQAAIRKQAEEEIKANGGKPDEAAKEREGIEAMCAALGVKMHEITPDGHCLYAAVADQLNIKGKTTAPVDYKQTRKMTADMMRRNPDDFKPFISDSDEYMAGIDNKEAGTTNSEEAQNKHYLNYCDAIENTGVWGGQPEILALSRAFETQINVVQAGTPVLKVGEGEYQGDPLIISYHRKMYGLGEHYNSLRPAPSQP